MLLIKTQQKNLSLNILPKIITKSTNFIKWEICIPNNDNKQIKWNNLNHIYHNRKMGIRLSVCLFTTWYFYYLYLGVSCLFKSIWKPQIAQQIKLIFSTVSKWRQLNYYFVCRCCGGFRRLVYYMLASLLLKIAT